MSIQTSILINAEPEAIWAVLMQPESFPEWNPFIQELTGDLELGGKLVVELKNGEKTMTFKPKVIAFEENKVFAWKGKLLLPWIFDGSHYFELEKVDGGTRLIHREEFKGILVWPILKMIGTETQNNFEAMNRALKTRVEALA